MPVELGIDQAVVRRHWPRMTICHTIRSEPLRRGARAVIDAEDLATADDDLIAAYRRQPPDSAIAQSAVRLAARTAPAW